MVYPTIDIINAETFEYVVASSSEYGGFSNQLIFEWHDNLERENIRRNNDSTLPLRQFYLFFISAAQIFSYYNL